jgi:hypothetical protein
VLLKSDRESLQVPPRALQGRGRGREKEQRMDEERVSMNVRRMAALSLLLR